MSNSAFKYCCRSRGEKLERTNLTYACLARVVRDGGFKIALVARLSAIPGHCESVVSLLVAILLNITHANYVIPTVTTGVFSACGMGIIVFSIAAILSMPKQFITVYLGVILEQSGTGELDGDRSHLCTMCSFDAILIILFSLLCFIRHGR